MKSKKIWILAGCLALLVLGSTVFFVLGRKQNGTTQDQAAQEEVSVPEGDQKKPDSAAADSEKDSLTGESAPAQTDGESAPAKTDGENTPAQTEGKNTPAQAAGDEKPGVTPSAAGPDADAELPEIEIPDAVPGPDPQPDGSGITVTDNGDIQLPEVP